MFLIVILLISAILRFYNLPELFIFGGDEEHQSILAQSIVEDFHLIWVGVNAGHLGFYLGPYWTYFTAFWLFLSGGHPLITGYIASLIGVITTLTVYLVGRDLFSNKVGLIASALYASLPLIVFFDQKYWNPTLIPLLTLLLLYTLFKTTLNPIWWIVFAFLYGLIFHLHLSLAPLILVVLLHLFSKKLSINPKLLALVAVAFVISTLPLIVFDYFHKGSNITTPLRFQSISEAKENNINPQYHAKAWFQTLGRIWYLQPFGDNSDEVLFSCTSLAGLALDQSVDKYTNRTKPNTIISLLSLLGLTLFIVNPQTWKKTPSKLTALFLITITVSFLFFPGLSAEYYLLGTFPLMMFVPGLLMEYYSKFRVPILLLVLLSICLGIFTVLTNNPQFGLQAKYRLINEIGRSLNNESFEVKQTGSCHHYEGWRYLFVVNNLKPERSQSDESLGWLYKDEITTKPVMFTVTLSETRFPVNFDTSNLTKFQEKGFTGYLQYHDQK